MRMLLGFLSAIVVMLFAVAAYAGCPAGYERSGNRCVRYSCPPGSVRDGNRCASCRPGCTYIGGGKCRCRR